MISIDGEPTTYDLDDVTFSPAEGADDLTFETCDPDFFGSGRFYAIGYAVDGEGELIVGNDGNWHLQNEETGEQTELASAPLVRDDNKVTGSLDGLQQIWPDEGAATVDVTFDLEIPSEINEEC
ncbi:MAG: hypothetical protein ACLFRT_00045 [Actinomycetota bacterium]